MLSLALETALGVSCNIRPVTGIWMRLSQDFQKKKKEEEKPRASHFASISLFSGLFVFMYVRARVCSCSWSRSLADIYRRVRGACRITFHRRGPREQRGFLSATWLSVDCSATPPLLPVSPPPPPPPSPPAPRPKPPPKLQRSPYCWQLSLPPLLLPSLKTPALPPLAADTASTAGVL